MTNTPLTPGSEWLLPVRYMLTSGRYGMEFDTASDTITVSHEDCESLIPASRLADLEAEVVRWQRLYEDARHDLTKSETEVARLREEMLRERD